jgi:predicted enzyme related to lactoylglutathione lyase
MIVGFRTMKYPTPDLTAAIVWYTKAFGVAPYFQEPYYVGFNIGGFELGLVPDGVPGEAGCVGYWGVTDIEAEVERFVKELGSTVIEPVTEVGEGIKVASVSDPFGNQIGLILNPLFKPTDVK